MRPFVIGAFALVAAILAMAFGPLRAGAPSSARAALETTLRAEPCAHAKAVPSELKLPAVVPPGDPIAIENRILTYLQSYRYRDLGWCVDKAVRDTGPYIMGVNYGTHRTVRIYYSPEVMAWLRGGRHGAPRDGAVIIKEQYGATPAIAYAGLRDGKLKPTDWTFMIRRASASRDGWFWGEVYTGMFPTPAPPPAKPPVLTAYPNAGFGLYCLRCHASADKAQTFSALDNIKGFAGTPLIYRVDDTWRTPPPGEALPPTAAPSVVPEHEKNKVEPGVAATPGTTAHALAPQAFQTFPAEPLDTQLAHRHGPPLFLTSDQCMGCHSAASGPPTGPTMWFAPNPRVSPTPAPNGGPVGANVSEYGEWRWSPMGLAGRDPVFFSQLESEREYIASIPAAKIAGRDPARTRAVLQQQVVDLCMRCHGVMGKRTNEIDHGSGAHFDERWVFEADPAQPQFHYGGLARDGISCTVCHHIAQTKREAASLAYDLETTNTGLFEVNKADQIGGPFESKQVATHPMKESLGATPVFSSLTKSARLCTSCHSIDLPVVDSPAKIHPIIPVMAHDVEQNTYVEWVNSRFQTEYKPEKGAKSCQDCHMPASVRNDGLGIDVPQIQTRIALIQDDTYPQAEHLAPLDDITVRYRKSGFRRHELLGLNAFLLRTFQTNADALGVRTGDYMSGSTSDLHDAIGFVIQQAQQQSAKVDVQARVDNGTLVARVGVLNLTGHRFPSGVGFRRAFIELKVTDPEGRVLFDSGGTNANGEIVGADGKPLPSESFARLPDGRQAYQPHYDVQHPIANAGQAQIFEELVQDDAGDFTTSFIRRDRVFKDNRLLPQGWRKDGQPGIVLPPHWLEATHPVNVRNDPHYADGSGRAVTAYAIPLRTAVDPARLRVEATLWYESWNPNFRRLRTSGNGPAATRLRALLGNLKLDQTPQLADWKLRIASAAGPVR
jgi:hypothetical protein